MKLHNHNSYPDWEEITYWLALVVAVILLVYVFMSEGGL
jgi:hypothetical protein